jgi:hypothetical protein
LKSVRIHPKHFEKISDRKGKSFFCIPTISTTLFDAFILVMDVEVVSHTFISISIKELKLFQKFITL